MKLLVTGAGGLLGRELSRAAREHGHDVVALDRAALDITDSTAARTAVLTAGPDAIVHCAGFTNVDAAEADPDAAFRVNVDGTANVARAAAEAGARYVYISTDYVFDGAQNSPYLPDDPTNPLGEYGRSKLGGEQAARLAGDWMVARVSWMYGRGGSNFGSKALERARAGETLRAFTDLTSVPTWVGSAADTILRLLEHDAPPGIYHANNAGATSWFDFANEALRVAGVPGEVQPTRVADVALPARRPAYSVMDVSATERVTGRIADWREALSAAVAHGI